MPSEELASATVHPLPQRVTIGLGQAWDWAHEAWGCYRDGAGVVVPADALEDLLRIAEAVGGNVEPAVLREIRNRLGR